MLRKKFTIIGSVGAILASSLLGATAVRSPEAGATLDATGATELVDVATEELDKLGETTLEVALPVTGGGAGESLVLVVAAQVAPSDAAGTLEEVNAAFGELQGFSTDASENYELTGAFVQTSPDTVTVACVAEELDCPEGVTSVDELQPVELQLVPSPLESFATVLGAELGFVPGRSLVLTGFRTMRGAEEFLELARAVGVSGLVTVQVRKLGGGDVGLGQEPHPDGSGPLLGPLPDQERYQR